MAVYNAYEELERLGLFSYREPGSKRALWRVSDANRAFGLCDTYPATLAFPDSVTDDTLAAAAAFRARARLPTLCWIHPQLKTSLWRSSQPAVGIVGSTSAADEVLLGEIRRCHPVTGGPLGANTPLVVADCRPAANAFANKAKGYGYETYSFTSVKFLDMHNIHRVRDAYNALEALILSTQPHAQHSSTRAHGEGAHKTASAAAVAMYTAAVSTVMGGSSGSSGGATPSTSSSILVPPSRTAAVDTRHVERSHQFLHIRTEQRAAAFAEHAVAYMIVILGEHHKLFSGIICFSTESFLPAP
ncbi:MAG: hypothetical protein EOO65_04455 [Methanosarcinales archaeon]|nr:MAG: hypothetical protein EOO65_04455 [Methanosarcinales archaeon]